MSLKRISLLICMLLSLTVVRASGPGDVVDKCAAAINSSPSVTVDFTVVDDAGNQLESTLIVAKDKFRLTTPEMETWFDGKTQWTLFPQASQLSISEPTPSELIDSNPLAVVNNWRSLYTASATGRKDEVRLTAKNKSTSFRTVLITADAGTSYPAKILVTLSNGRTATILVKNIHKGKAMPLSTFRCNPDAHKVSEVIDLR